MSFSSSVAPDGLAGRPPRLPVTRAIVITIAPVEHGTAPAAPWVRFPACEAERTSGPSRSAVSRLWDRSARHRGKNARR
jgi:hypothetical protein